MMTSYEGDLALSERDLLLQHVEFSNASGRRVVLPSAEFAVPLMENSREISKFSDFAEKIAVGVDHDNPIAFQRKPFLASLHCNSNLFVSWSTIF
jgi:hypothetical protein